jgi:hypothetical protein
MRDTLQKTSARKPFRKRLKGSAIIFLIISFLLGLGWFLLAWSAVLLTPNGNYDEHLRAQNLPLRETLSVAEGRVVDMGYYVSRRRQFVKPKVEYAVDGKNYRAETIDGYAPDLFPFKQFQTAEVLYLPNQPEKAWQKWEYDKLIGDYENAVAVPLIFKVKTIYYYLAFGIIALSGLFLSVNLFVPLIRFIKGE